MTVNIIEFFFSLDVIRSCFFVVASPLTALKISFSVILCLLSLWNDYLVPTIRLLYFASLLFHPRCSVIYLFSSLHSLLSLLPVAALFHILFFLILLSLFFHRYKLSFFCVLIILIVFHPQTLYAYTKIYKDYIFLRSFFFFYVFSTFFISILFLLKWHLIVLKFDFHLWTSVRVCTIIKKKH